MASLACAKTTQLLAIKGSPIHASEYNRKKGVLKVSILVRNFVVHVVSFDDEEEAYDFHVSSWCQEC